MHSFLRRITVPAIIGLAGILPTLSWSQDHVLSEVTLTGEGFINAQVNQSFEAELFVQIDDMIVRGVEFAETDKAVRRINVDRWPNGNIPIAFGEGYTEDEQAVFFTACNRLADVAHVSCTERVDEPNFVRVEAATLDVGNNSMVGMIGGEQTLNLFNRNNQGIIMHELLHAFGFVHQHQAPNRNRYVQIEWDNIEEDMRSNFNTLDGAITRSTEGYDYCSIMHYELDAFSVDGSPTINVTVDPVPECNNGLSIGQKNYVSVGDMIGLVDAYGRDLTDTSTLVVPDFTDNEHRTYATRDGDFFREKYALIATILGDAPRTGCTRMTTCESKCWETVLIDQSIQPGTEVVALSPITLTRETRLRYRTNTPPRGRLCE